MNEKIPEILRQIETVVVGKNEIVEKILMAILAGGHVLMEDVPGVGKTTTAMTFAKVLGLDTKRVQFTSDTVPSDIIGYSVYDKESGSFVYKPGAVMTNLLLADEINRTSSKTQAALLEAMEESNVTVEGKTYALPRPHLVIATQNPLGCVGTQSLPESQLDRFLMRLHMGYPEIQDEVAILKGHAARNPLEDVQPVCTPEQLEALQQQAAAVYVDDRLYYYAASVSRATREHPQAVLGVSPRGTLALIQSAKAMAMLRGRDYLLPDDIMPLCQDVLAHRILTKGGVAAEQVLDEVLHQVPAPMPDRR